MPLVPRHVAVRSGLNAMRLKALSLVVTFILAAGLGGVVVATEAWAQNSGTSLGTKPQIFTSPPTSFNGNGVLVALRHHVTISGEVVRLSDLFDGVPPDKDKQVLRSPELGKTVTLDMAYLSRLAQNEGLNWTPLSQSEQSVITRSSGQISADEILANLTRELVQKGMPPTAEIESTPPVVAVPIPVGVTPTIEVYDVTFNRAESRFSANVDIQAPQMAPHHLVLSGLVFETIDVPVLETSVNRGQVLAAKDIGFIRQRASTLQGSDVVTDFDQVLGKAVRRAMRPGDFFRSHDLDRPALVTKGSVITMVLRTPLMSLTAQGRALQDGAMGDVIKVQNPRSGKTVLGTVIESRTVEVDPTQSTALQ